MNKIFTGNRKEDTEVMKKLAIVFPGKKSQKLF